MISRRVIPAPRTASLQLASSASPHSAHSAPAAAARNRVRENAASASRADTPAHSANCSPLPAQWFSAEI